MGQAFWVAYFTVVVLAAALKLSPMRVMVVVGVAQVAAVTIACMVVLSVHLRTVPGAKRFAMPFAHPWSVTVMDVALTRAMVEVAEVEVGYIQNVLAPPPGCAQDTVPVAVMEFTKVEPAHVCVVFAPSCNVRVRSAHRSPPPAIGAVVLM